MSTTIRNGKLFCTKCGEGKDIPYPLPFRELSEMMEQYQEAHEECLQTWTQPIADLNTSIEERMEFWLTKGERGTSSEVMFQRLSGKDIGQASVNTHPSDSMDFGRCYMLLEAIPEWKAELHKLKEISNMWNGLVCNWDVLSAMYVEQIDKKQDCGMYRFMQNIFLRYENNY